MKFLEFFAGGGMARLGLADHFECVFANDYDTGKCKTYRANFGGEHLVEADIASLCAEDLPQAELAWASFPCQDLSLAGNRGGMAGSRSGTFWAFWKLMTDLKCLGRAPSMIVIENVTGLLSSRGGNDLDVLVQSMGRAGYNVGAAVIDAASFVPQSRPRIFSVACDAPQEIPAARNAFQHPMLSQTNKKLSAEAQDYWRKLELPKPPVRRLDLVDVVDFTPPSEVWRDKRDLDKLLGQMAPLHKARVDAAVESGERRVGAVYRRIRKGEQRAEVRYDGLAGCIRTLKGGSSRQLLLISEKGRLGLRPMLGAEAARLMGLPVSYQLPKSQTAAISLCGDGLCVPAISWLSTNLLAPILQQKPVIRRKDERIGA